MAWFRVDDQFWKHPKAIAAGHAALGAWLLLGSLAADLDRDGTVPAMNARAFASAGQLRRLCAVGLLDAVPGGYRLHDWEQWSGKRAMTPAERQAEHRRRRRASHDVSRNVTDAVPTPDTRHPSPESPTDDRQTHRARARSSSSGDGYERALSVAALALAEQQGNTRQRYVAGIRRNLDAERRDEIEALLTRLDPVAVAGEIVGSKVAARNAARDLDARTDSKTNETGGPK